MTRRVFPVAAFVLAVAIACGDGAKAPPAVPAGPMPDTFRVAFETTRGRFVVEAYRHWSPLGVKRFHELAAMGAFDDNSFYRVIPNFIAQFGIPGDPKLTVRLDSIRIPDEPRLVKNLRGTIAYAQEGPGSRSHTFYVNRRDADHLDTQGFTPFGRVIEGMAVIDSIQFPYRDRPDYHLIATLGNKYLKRMYPKTDYISSARLVR